MGVSLHCTMSTGGILLSEHALHLAVPRSGDCHNLATFSSKDVTSEMTVFVECCLPQVMTTFSSGGFYAYGPVCGGLRGF